MDRATAMNSFWRRTGPPLPIAVHVIGQSLGIDWKTGPSTPSADVTPLLSIAETLAMAPKPLD